MLPVSEGKSEINWVLPTLDVVTSLVALLGLLPMAGGLSSIASTGEPLSDGIWFTINLGGAFLLLAGGVKLLLRAVPLYPFVFAYAVSIAVLGTVRLQLVGFHRLVTGWLLVALFVGGLLLLLRRPWLWPPVGAAWCALLLGIWSAGGVIGYLSAAAPQFPFFLPVQMLGCVGALVLLIFHIVCRRAAIGG